MLTIEIPADYESPLSSSWKVSKEMTVDKDKTALKMLKGKKIMSNVINCRAYNLSPFKSPSS